MLTSLLYFVVGWKTAAFLRKVGDRRKSLVFKPDPYGRFMHHGVRYGWVVAERA